MEAEPTPELGGGKPVFVCKCAKFKLELSGDPIVCFNCMCPSCIATVDYVDAKSPRGKSCKSISGGSSWVLWECAKVKALVSQPEEKLCYITVGNSGTTVRSFTKCCNTMVMGACGAELSFDARPLNRNSIVMLDGSAWLPPQKEIYNQLMKHFIGDASTVPEPKCDGLAPGCMPKALPLMFLNKFCCLTVQPAQFLNPAVSEATEVVPKTW
jgi:hypothetical protein